MSNKVQIDLNAFLTTLNKAEKEAEKFGPYTGQREKKAAWLRGYKDAIRMAINEIHDQANS